MKRIDLFRRYANCQSNVTDNINLLHDELLSPSSKEELESIIRWCNWIAKDCNIMIDCLEHEKLEGS